MEPYKFSWFHWIITIKELIRWFQEMKIRKGMPRNRAEIAIYNHRKRLYRQMKKMYNKLPRKERHSFLTLIGQRRRA